MKFFFAIVCLVFFSGNQELVTVRENYILASQSKEKAEEFNKLMVSYSGENKTLLAYKGASIALKAKFASDRKTKKELFTKGITILEQAVKADSNNAEIRLIRLSIQENTPKILNYKANISEDKKLILTTFDKQNKALQEHLKSFIMQSKSFTAQEKELIAN
ncbi:hypothetical protein EQG68_09940 [Flavobacterium piscinae]|uniref:Uncharacterized protein n=1 Tax=Flavobacterium piscinae TaxID=2506424 RepID=A0A4Q1KQ01_9FLAO|nr:hypothetical protein [Flavobacterium piscinae]RXR31570.1 hypothetical protein EQG68_09940 [Flavobacterium piscinae]